MQIKDAKDFWSGVMFTAFGAFFIFFARDYDMGTAARMGPAFFPTALGALLALLGILIAVKGLTAETKDGAVAPFRFKPLVLVLGAVIAFGLLLRPAGLLVALAALVIVSSLGSEEFRLRDVLILTVVLAVLVLIVFIYGLGMTVPVLPAFMSN
ncbi:MAG TPA: tripartite tricarboxylate transporter TctB family protein [Burkholderiaceae bacterium]|nr:tripartite tricarboxylate transporter TctB family protein [Burkholderiaceae bacterium]HQR69091.1 tripartite tricarboxylate transporter TctB family protein [Burkholderiaceae bacterium]